MKFEWADDLKSRSKQLAIRIIRFSRLLPNTPQGRLLGDQVMRSATSVAANYRAACRARSRAEFIAKLGTVVEEADETVFWLELLLEAGLADHGDVKGLLNESSQLLSIFSASRRTAKSRRVSSNQQIMKSTDH